MTDGRSKVARRPKKVVEGYMVFVERVRGGERMKEDEKSVAELYRQSQKQVGD